MNLDSIFAALDLDNAFGSADRGHALLAIKEAVRKGLDLTVDQGMRLEADLNVILHSTGDRAEGIRSFIEKRPPVYRGE